MNTECVMHQTSASRGVSRPRRACPVPSPDRCDVRARSRTGARVPPRSLRPAGCGARVRARGGRGGGSSSPAARRLSAQSRSHRAADNTRPQQPASPRTRAACSPADIHQHHTLLRQPAATAATHSEFSLHLHLLFFHLLFMSILYLSR